MDSYVQLGGVFMLVGGGCRFGEVFERRHSSEILYVFKQNGKVVSISSKTASALPHPLSSYVIDELQIHTCMEISFFGTVINERIIAGYYCKEHWQEKVTRVTRSLWTKLRSRHRSERTGYRLVPYLYEFDSIKGQWLPILPSDLQPVIYQNDIDCDLSFCGTKDSILVGLHINKGGEYGIGDDFDYKIACFRFDILAQHDSKSSDISNLNYIMSFLEFPMNPKEATIPLVITAAEPLEHISDDANSTIRENCMVQLELNEILLLGILESRETRIQRLWLGKLRTDDFNIIWRKLSVQPLREMRRKPICFKLQNNVYIMERFGVTSNSCMQDFKCERYNLNEEKYYAFDQELPICVKSVHAVVTDTEETFALILGAVEVCDPDGFDLRRYIHKPRLMLFTEKAGFHHKLKEIDLTNFVINAGIDFGISGTTLLKIT